MRELTFLKILKLILTNVLKSVLFATIGVFYIKDLRFNRTYTTIP